MLIEQNRLLPVLLGVHLVGLPLYPRTPVYVLLMMVLFSLWGVLVIRGVLAMPGRVLRLLAAAGVIAALLLSYGSIIGQGPGISMLLMLCLLKLFEVKSQRDLIVIIYLGYFLSACQFFFSQSLWVTLYVFICVTYLTALLISFSDRLGSMNMQSYLRLSARLSMQAVPLMLILFVLFPRIPGPLWGLPEDAQVAQTGISDEMSPGSINRLISSDEVAFRVKFSGEVPANSQLYWRGLVLSQYDGRSWKRDDAPRYARPDIVTRTEIADVSDYTVSLEPHNQKWLYSLEQLTAYQGEFWLSREMQLLSQDKISSVTIYTADSHTGAFNRGLFQPERIKNLHLPEAYNPETLELAASLRRQAGDDDAKLVQEVLSLFSQQNFVYTLSPPLLGINAMDDFLFETRRGFCEHYASAFVYLMRAAGVPARIVIGYQGGRLNPLDDYMIVRQSDAHAWTEVWLAKRGWVRVDPTAVVSPARIEQGIQAAGLNPALLPSMLLSNNRWLIQSRYLWDSFHHNWNQWVVGFNERKQKELFKALGFENVNASMLVLWMVVLMTVAGGVVAWWVFRSHASGSKDPVSLYYNKFCEKIEKAGVKRQPNEGPLEFMARIADGFPGLDTEQAEGITRAYVKLRYGGSADDDLMKIFMRSVNRFRLKKSL